MLRAELPATSSGGWGRCTGFGQHQAGRGIDAVIANLLDEPACAHAEQEAPIGDVIDRRHLLGEHDRIELGDDAHPRPEPEEARARCGCAERGERVEQPGILAGTVALQDVAPACGDVRVSGEEQRFEPGRSTAGASSAMPTVRSVSHTATPSFIAPILRRT